MNKGLFAGWKDVFSFTFKQSASNKYKKLTVILSLVFLVGCAAISMIMAYVQKTDADYVSPIEKVYVVDDSEMMLLYLDSFGMNEEEVYKDLTFDTTKEEVSAAVNACGAADVVLHIEKSKKEQGGYICTLMIPQQNEMVSSDDGDRFLESFGMSMETSKMLSSGIPMEKLVYALSGTNVEEIIAGEEEKSLGEEMVQMLFPMLVMFLLYFMVLVYGMSIGNSVNVEKASKLMEMILTLTKPYGLILGKVLALCATAFIQIIAWFVSIAVGFVLGDVLAKELIYADYSNVLVEVFEVLRGGDAFGAFSPAVIVFGLILLLIGFVMYSALAAFVASFATKAEDLASTMSFYQIAMVVGFFASYMLPLQEKEWINVILRIVPLTAAFKLPGDLMVGNIPMWQGFVYGGLLLASTLGACFLAGYVYKKQLFHRGKSLKDFFVRKKTV